MEDYFMKVLSLHNGIKQNGASHGDTQLPLANTNSHGDTQLPLANTNSHGDTQLPLAHTKF